jgi:hypothetical protein
MTRLLRPAVLLALALALAAALTACGPGHKESRTGEGETEGVYLDVGGLKYHVETSRQLNPYTSEDGSYLAGIPFREQQQESNSVWFAVFLRVEAADDRAEEAATDFEIEDTQRNVFRPIALPASNNFAYRGGVVRPGNPMPDPNSAAGQRAPNGSMLLFRMPRFSFDNRPLELRIHNERGESGKVNLDV